MILNNLHRFSFAIILSLLMLGSAFARSITPSDIDADVVRERQLVENSEALYPSYTSYLYMSWLFWPNPSWMTMKTPYGDVYGYPYQQRFAVAMMESIKKTSWDVGFSWNFDRFGWDDQQLISDFKFNKFGQGYAVNSFGVWANDSLTNQIAGLGLTWERNSHTSVEMPEANDSLYFWMHYGISKINFNLSAGRDYLYTRLGFELENREVHGDKLDSWMVYAPNLYLTTVFTDLSHEPKKLSAEILQNIWSQKLYLKASAELMEKDDVFGILRFHPDKGHMVTMDASFWYKDGKVVPGFALEVPFLRLAYSHPEDSRYFFDQQGVWTIAFNINLNTIAKSHMLRRNAPKASKMETIDMKTKTVKKNKI